MIEHQVLFKAIRQGNPVNNGEYMVRSTLMGIMGRINYHTGKEVTWDQVSSSDFHFPPKPEECRIDMEPSAKINAEGIYPLAFTPGEAKLI